MSDDSPLLQLLSGSVTPDQLDEETFSLALAEARANGLLGRLAHRLRDSTALTHLPAHLGDQLAAADIHAERFRQDVRRELGHLEQALSRLNTPVILLKGAAYVLLDLPAAAGRTFSDIDILVPRDRLPAAESALMLGGWSAGRLSAYDQRYYREWSHEIPPMRHVQRGTTVDLHHSLAMPTCRIEVDSERMLAEALPVSPDGFWWRLKDEDILLHAASHFLLNVEFNRGLRDLGDIDLLYRHFDAHSDGFAEHLLYRSWDVGLEDILRQTLWLASLFFHTPVPWFLLPTKPSLFSRLVQQAASTRHPDTRPPGQQTADLLLMLHEMYLRLPNRLLLIHLMHKMGELFRRSEHRRP